MHEVVSLRYRKPHKILAGYCKNIRLTPTQSVKYLCFLFGFVFRVTVRLAVTLCIFYNMNDKSCTPYTCIKLYPQYPDKTEASLRYAERDAKLCLSPEERRNRLKWFTLNKSECGQLALWEFDQFLNGTSIEQIRHWRYIRRRKQTQQGRYPRKHHGKQHKQQRRRKTHSS